MDYALVVFQHRHQLLAAEGDLVLLPELDGNEFSLQAFVPKRHARAPAKRAEAFVRPSLQLVEIARHSCLPASLPSGRDYNPPTAI